MSRNSVEWLEWFFSGARHGVCISQVEQLAHAAASSGALGAGSFSRLDCSASASALLSRALVPRRQQREHVGQRAELELEVVLAQSAQERLSGLRDREEKECCSFRAAGSRAVRRSAFIKLLAVRFSVLRAACCPD
jgi:hypothetical protein